MSAVEHLEPASVHSLLTARAEAMRGRAALLAPDEAEHAGDGHTAPDPAAAAERRWHRICPQRFHRVSLDFAGLDPESRGHLVEWGRAPQGRNLVLLGPVGVGKTAAALAACRRAVVTEHLTVRFSPVVELLDALRPGGPDDAMEALVDIDRLIVDDLGTEKRTDWTDERLYAVLNRRWLEERPTVVTSNLPAKDLEEHIGPRLFSRIVGNDAVCLRLTGPDYRRAR